MGVQTPVARSAINSLTQKGFKMLELKVGKIVYSVDKEAFEVASSKLKAKK